MSLAMMNYMPIRGMLSFGGGAFDDEQMEQILKMINE